MKLVLLLQNKARSDGIKPENLTGLKKEYAEYRLMKGLKEKKPSNFLKLWGWGYYRFSWTSELYNQSFEMFRHNFGVMNKIFITSYEV